MPLSHTFAMHGDGLYPFEKPHNPEEEGVWVRIAGRFEIVATVSDPRDGGSYGLLITFIDERGRNKQTVVSAASLQSASREVCGRLSSLGLHIDRNCSNEVAEYLNREMQYANSADIAMGPGWLGPRTFVLPTESFGAENHDHPIFYAGDDKEDYYRVSGTLEEWQQHIGVKCIGNSRLVLSVCCAFAGPLLRLTGAESGGVHLRGLSSLGKTTAQIIAGSVLGGGGPKGFARSWNSTINGFEGIAARHNDSLLILDELKEVDPREAIKVVYMLANDIGKGRMNADGTQRHTNSWRLMLLSSGEISLETHAGATTQGGAHVRLMDLDADAGAGMGLFENLHGAPSPEAFAKQLKTASLALYGTPFRLYLQVLCAMDAAARLEVIRDLQKDFLSACQLGPVSPEVGRVVSRMSLLAAAGELATMMDITGWPQGEAITQIKRCLDVYIAAHGGATASHDERQMIAQVRAYLEQNGQSHFAPIGNGL
jgi:putative DNA primase/helicase